MIKLFRKIRHRMLIENKFSKYLIYAIGEIVLVVIGILIALNINNWNENRKDKSLMVTNIKSIAREIQIDSRKVEKTIKILELQINAGNNLIPIMESDTRIIPDSLEFILDFNDFTNTPIISKQNNTWDYFNSSGILSQFSDPDLLNMLEDYYSEFNSLATNFSNTAIPARLEIRELKYELFKDTEHRKFFPTNSPMVPSKEVYVSIFNDNRVLPLCRYISSTARYFNMRFKSTQLKAGNIVHYINSNYN
jgi:hypothetical protein